MEEPMNAAHRAVCSHAPTPGCPDAQRPSRRRHAPLLPFLLMAAACLAAPGARSVRAAPRDTAGLAAVARSAAMLGPATSHQAAEYTALASRRPELQRAAEEVRAEGWLQTPPRVVRTTFGWVGVHYGISPDGAGQVGQYALWFDGASREVVAQALFIDGPAQLRARISVHGNLVFDGLVDDPEIDGDKFWDCLNQCTGKVLDHRLYMLIRAVCSRACVPVTPYCAPCVIALSALEAGMISGCVHSCIYGEPGGGSGSWRSGLTVGAPGAAAWATGVDSGPSRGYRRPPRAIARPVALWRLDSWSNSEAWMLTVAGLRRVYWL
jgi:hypothetical protein